MSLRGRPKCTPRERAASRARLVRSLTQIPNFQVALCDARELLAEWVDKGDAVDLAIRKKIASLKRGVVEGSAEWSILYRRYREDELRKKGPQR